MPECDFQKNLSAKSVEKDADKSEAVAETASLKLLLPLCCNEQETTTLAYSSSVECFGPFPGRTCVPESIFLKRDIS
jgi:hypothetical protein